MSLIEKVFNHLHEHAFVETAEEFSTDWCWRSKSWFAVQKSKDSDFSIPVAITCLNNVKMKIAFAHLRRRKLGSIADSDIQALGEVKAMIEEHLLERHRIAEVAEDAQNQNVR